MQTFHSLSGSTGGEAFIVGNAETPYKGQKDCAHEFQSYDASGIRSSITYVWDSIRFYIPHRAMLEVLGEYPRNSRTAGLDERLKVAMGDFLFKVETGYVGFQHGKQVRVYYN